MGTPEVILSLLEIAYDVAVKEGWLGTAQAVSDASARLRAEQATAEGSARAADRSSRATSAMMAARRSKGPAGPRE